MIPQELVGEGDKVMRDNRVVGTFLAIIVVVGVCETFVTVPPIPEPNSLRVTISSAYRKDVVTTGLLTGIANLNQNQYPLKLQKINLNSS